MTKANKIFTAISAAVLAAVAIVAVVARFQPQTTQTTTQAQMMPASLGAPSEATLLDALSRTGQDTARVKVQVVDGIVLLKGSSSNRESIAVAEKTVRDLGVTRVANLIELKKGATDEQIVREAEVQLGRTRSLDGCRLAVRAKNGVVTVAGRFQTETQKDAAEQIVRRIQGVKQVVRATSLPVDPTAVGAGL